MLRSRPRRSENGLSWEDEELEDSDLDLPTSSTHPGTALRRSSWTAQASTRRRTRNAYVLLSFLCLSCLCTTILILRLRGSTILEHVAPSSKIFHQLGAKTPSGNASIPEEPRKNIQTLPNGKLPVVDRSILQKLALLETEPEPGYERYHNPSRSLNAWPPLVTHIPESNLPTSNTSLSPSQQFQFQHSPPSTLPLPIFSQGICGRPACLFILPFRVPEQESKARLHLSQILELGSRLGRIVVLPGVGKSRMGACARWDFEHYYDIGKMSLVGEEHSAGTAIDAETFRLWTSTRPEPPSVQFLSIEARPFSGTLENSTIFGEQGLTTEIPAFTPISLSNSSETSELPLPDLRCLQAFTGLCNTIGH
ncbi:hypothetical protein HWV62_17970 [Athelia sp. TMB]|nr:hypothetical protein HWV62_17970 [Athelia sp. TMB]